MTRPEHINILIAIVVGSLIMQTLFLAWAVDVLISIKETLEKGEANEPA
jgi:hypothetical protein